MALPLYWEKEPTCGPAQAAVDPLEPAIQQPTSHACAQQVHAYAFTLQQLFYGTDHRDHSAVVKFRHVLFALRDV